ncbi:putative acyltransferase [Lachnospiraceae bacterium JC7]|nr:putative acyltransferase [Lachnospiraceae bacterium JC7]
MSQNTKPKRLLYLDSLKYIFCLIIFWTHFTGVFWTMCEVKPDLRPELQMLFLPPLSILVDSNLALYGFCIISGYLASFKKISSLKELLLQLVGRYIRFVVPFFFINTITFLMYYTLGFPTLISSELLHNSWVSTFYNHPYGINELIMASLTMDGTLNGPLWMMKYIFGGTCLIYVYNYIRHLCTSGNSSKETSPVLFFVNAFALILMAISFVFSPEPNFFHLVLVLMGTVMMYLDKLIKRKFRSEENVSPVCDLIFLVVALIPVILDAGGLVNYISPYVHRNYPDLLPYFTWNMYWVIGFSFFLIMGIMNCRFLQKILELGVMKRLAPTNFSVYLIHFPLICCLSLKLYILMVNRISYTKEFIIIAVITFIGLFIAAPVYELTIGKLQNRVIGFFVRALNRL